MRYKRFFLPLVFIFLASPVWALGYVEKDSYLYPIMIDIRHKKYDEAMAKLEPYVKQNDSEALFWYGYMKQQSFGRDRYGAYRWFEQSAELGNPYAMFKLSGADNTKDVCETNGWECTSSNLDLAINRWRELSEAGDERAKYWLYSYDSSLVGSWFGYFLGERDKRIRQACENGYCKPLVRLIKWSDKDNSRESWGDDVYDMFIDFADKDPAIATYRAAYAFEGLTDNQRIKLLIDSLQKGYYPSANYFYDFAKKGVLSYEDAYVYAEAANLGGAENALTVLITNKGLVSEKKIPELKLRAKEFYEKIDHVINFDEMDFMFMFRPDV